MAGVGPRAVGVRIGYGDLPLAVHRWVGARAGPAEVVMSHSGGMSPGAAVTLRSSNGQKVFVKAVGSSLNEQTPALFRAEIGVLQSLPRVAYRAALIAYDDGDWVALLLEHVDGRCPDMGNETDAAAVEATVLAQTDALTPPPRGVQSTQLATTILRWQHRWEEVRAEPGAFLPAWAGRRPHPSRGGSSGLHGTFHPQRSATSTSATTTSSSGLTELPSSWIGVWPDSARNG